MTAIKILAFLTGTAILAAGCKKDEAYMPACSDGPVNYRLVNDDLNPAVDVQNFDAGDTLAIQVIQNENQLFTDLRFAFLRTKIDFKKETLLVGLVRTHSLAEVTAQQVESNCTAKEIVLRTTIRIGGIPSADYVPVCAIVPKISDETRVRIVAEKI